MELSKEHQDCQGDQVVEFKTVIKGDHVEKNLNQDLNKVMDLVMMSIPRRRSNPCKGVIDYTFFLDSHIFLIITHFTKGK